MYLKIKENSINVENCSYQSPEMRLQLFAPPPGREGIRGEDVSMLATSVDVAVRVDTCCGRTVSSVSPRQVGDGPCSFRELCPARDCVHTHTRTRSLTHTHTQCLTSPAYLTEHAEPHLCRQPPRGPSSLFTPAPQPPPWPRVTVPNSAFSPLHRGPGTLTQRCPRAPPAGSCVRPSAQGRAAPTSQGGWVCLHP